MTISFLNSDGDTEKWEFSGSSWAVDNFSQVGEKGISNLDKKKLDINSKYSESKITDNSDGFYFTDKNGNIVAKILSDGLHAVALYDKDGNKIGSADASIESIKDKIKQDGFYFTDAVGNVIAKITKDGLQAIKFLDKEGNVLGGSQKQTNHPLSDKDIYSLGNSLCGGGWEQKLAELTGARFNKEANKLTSWGGTFTGDAGGPLYNEEGYGVNGDNPGGIRRAKNFVLMPKEIYGNKDVIFFENVHDSFIEDENLDEVEPFFWTQHEFYNDKSFNTHDDAQSYFNSNFNQIISVFSEKKPDSIVHLKINTLTKKIVFTAGASRDGNVIVHVGDKIFSTSVNAGDSIEQVIDKISVWSFRDTTNWENKKLDSTTIRLMFTGSNKDGSPEDIISVDTGETGVTVDAITETTSISYRSMAFKSLDIENWGDVSYWKYYNGDYDLSADWKGVIEHIQKNYPETQMYMLLFPNSSYNKDNMTRADGSFSLEKFYKSSNQVQHINNRNGLRRIAEYYNIPVIDVERELMIGANWETYYNENDVHFKSTLYERIARIIANKVY